jgi:prolyl 4-hydroxylase
LQLFNPTLIQFLSLHDITQCNKHSLSDVEEGGETYFNKLDLAVKPKKGRALVWPSVVDNDPEFWDARMYHEAKDVIKGKKLAANHWIHLNDYITPNNWGCTGSFS